MGQINQFAKISPLVNYNGELLDINNDGTVKLDSDNNPIIFKDSNGNSKKLKNNELGIIYSDNALVTMYNGKVVILNANVYNNADDFNNLINSNIDGRLDGKLVVVKRDSSILNDRYGYDIKIIQGTNAYNVTDNLLYSDYFAISHTSSTHINSFIGVLPYRIMRITARMKNNITRSDNNEIFTGKINILSGEDLITSLDINRSIGGTNGYDLFECETIFKEFQGPIIINSQDNTGVSVETDGEIEFCIEYTLI